MIHPQCFTTEWLKRQAEAIGSRNPVMLEKSIIALNLLGHLAESGLPIQFKGGTSLLLRLNPIRRLSIDVDIVTQAKPEELLAVLARVSALSPLTGYEHDAQRDKELPPKKHFRFFYPSAIEPKTDHVLLDVLFEPQVAPYCEPVVINTPFITLEREVRVAVPTVNSLLGDKLTAFAPRTIGILYHPLRRTDIAKQLFDVGVLFDAATDLSVAAEAYSASHARQLVYRQAKFSLADTLNDSIEAGFLYCQLELRGGAKTEHGLFLQEGVNALQNHLVNQPFRRDEARIAAGKVACVAAWIQRHPEGVTIEQLRFQPDRIAELRDLQIEAPWSSLTRLKGGIVLVETEAVPLFGAVPSELGLFGQTEPASGRASKRRRKSAKAPSELGAPRRPRVRGRDLSIPMIPPHPTETGVQTVVALPDGEHEAVIRYMEKEVLVELRRKPPTPPNPNQMWLELT